MATVTTLTFSEETKGWTSFWDYEPLFAFSLSGRYFTINTYKLYEHYLPEATYSNFYGTQYDSEVTLILNDNSGLSKTFKTIGYEGSNGWEMSSFLSDEYAPTSNQYTPASIQDTGQAVQSYSEGLYLEGGVEYRAGFDRKENKYYANLINDSVTLREGQVLEGSSVSGIKGLFATVTFKTDSSTRLGGQKQLFSVFSEYSPSFY